MQLCRRRGRRRTGTAAIELDARRSERRKTRDWRRFRAPRHDSVDEDDEGDEAELFHRFDLLGGAPSGGDGRGTAAGRRCPAELGLGFLYGEEKWEGERESVALAFSLDAGSR